MKQKWNYQKIRYTGHLKFVIPAVNQSLGNISGKKFARTLYCFVRE